MMSGIFKFLTTLIGAKYHDLLHDIDNLDIVAQRHIGNDQ